jgi:tetratricopeptide (TPR) repeat protein
MLPYPDQFYLEAARGWLMLGDASAARAELEKLTPALRQAPEVLAAEWETCAGASDWQRAYEVAQQIVSVAPDEVLGWIHRAYAARRRPGGGLPQAWDALRPAVDRFPKESLVLYNLGCYAAQMGRLEEAWDWLTRALHASQDAAHTIQMALADSDLAPLWPRLHSWTKSS